ncbi:Ku DNA-binding complex, Ku70 subunit [Coniophora puteana RWD-64-598 SS2]|uniref:ATP-dependent DNA helicase II subunit 1 n=1 Tax=Coniophora puteana (strain RWD-64-598) TaxID=741705 RepID=A0A5M3MXB2_CONPW|nr:Ku DNA-binding complex, Ku70 subunit [Coniophora puteana RWD-64-598 SS2]EIW83647.1 Ku DNA-binding complex, Ku70 subunit [Coniophora puteana RWD-64-598 SS2]
MAPFDDWNNIDEEEEEELQDASYFEGKRDVILFCIDCSPSMQELKEDPVYEGVQTSRLLTSLEAAMQIQKKKVLVGPNDCVGILLFNTTRTNEEAGYASEIKKGCFVYQQLGQVNAPKIQELIQLVEGAREDSDLLKSEYPPLEGKRVPIGDVFTSCNWVIRDNAPKTATKRVFLITDNDDPHPGTKQLLTSARTTLVDLIESGVQVEPFFIGTEDRPFDPTKFYSSVLINSGFDDEAEDEGTLPESISITRINDLLAQMRIHEVPKRAIFNITFELANDFVIGVKGYGLVTEQKKGSYKYFVDLGDRMEVAESRTVYIDEEQQAEVEKSQLVYGMELGAPPANENSDDEMDGAEYGTRVVPYGQRPFYDAEEVRSFRTLELEPGLKLLGFKDRNELAFEDNVKHSTFIYPDEQKYAGSRRTFTAMLKVMLEKDKIGLVRALLRKNAAPVFCAMLPQAEKVEEGGWNEPGGFHLIPLPFADDIRAAPIEEGFRASDDVKNAARAWIDKLCVKNGAYPPDTYPNPALAFHNAQLQASAFREEFDPESFEDVTLPKYDMMHKRAGELIKEWKKVLFKDDAANTIIATAGTKRKADVSVDEAEIRSKYEDGTLNKLRNDQLKEFLKNKSQPVSGKKADLVERVADWLTSHS